VFEYDNHAWINVEDALRHLPHSIPRETLIQYLRQRGYPLHNKPDAHSRLTWGFEGLRLKKQN
jgi:hypothetical protein